MVTKIFKLTLYWLTKMPLVAQNTPKIENTEGSKNVFWVETRKNKIFIKFSETIIFYRMIT